MGWDYVSYGDRHAHLHDMQLWALRHFLSDAARALAAEQPRSLFAEASEFFTKWSWPGPGVFVGTNLDGFVRGSADRERILVDVCDRAIARLREFGEPVPLDYLEDNVNVDSPGGVYVGDQTTESLRDGVERIRALLTTNLADPLAPDGIDRADVQ